MQALTFFFAFVAVLALIGAAAWLVRRFAGNRLGANTNRGRMPRLAVIDAAAVDGRRRLVLVRRDNIEHLLMIGGPTDIVVEPNIVRAMPGRDQMPPRPAVGGTEPPPRIAPLPDAANWSDDETSRVRRLRSRRAANARAAAAAGAALFCRRSAPPGAGALGTPQRSHRSFGRLHAGAAGRPSRAPPRTAQRADAVAGDLAQRADDAAAAAAPGRSAEAAADSRRPSGRRPPPPPAAGPRRRAAGAIGADQNLAEMAQRLEAALRRPRRCRRTARRRAAGRARAAAEPRRAAHRAVDRAAGCAAPAPQRAALRISKTRWRPCWAVQSPLREIGDRPA